jgi:hypothetical protein
MLHTHTADSPRIVIGIKSKLAALRISDRFTRASQVLKDALRWQVHVGAMADASSTNKNEG